MNHGLPTTPPESWRNHVPEIEAWTRANERARAAYYAHLAAVTCIHCLRPRLKHTDVCGTHKAEKVRAAKAAYYQRKKGT